MNAKLRCGICFGTKSIRKYDYDVRDVKAGEPVCNKCCLEAIADKATSNIFLNSSRNLIRESE